MINTSINTLNLTKKIIVLTLLIGSFLLTSRSSTALAQDFTGDPMTLQEFFDFVGAEGEHLLPLYNEYKSDYCRDQLQSISRNTSGCKETVTFGEGLKAPGAGGLAGLANSTQREDGSTLDPLDQLESVISSIIGLLTTLAGVFFIAYFIIGSFSWIIAGGDQSKIQKARDQIVQGVIGLVVVVSAYAIVGLIGSIVGVDILNPAEQFRQIFGVGTTIN
jgi:TRAP-type C4-dicarboxylate transport system permease small subunit